MNSSSNALNTTFKMAIVILWWMTCFLLTVDTGLFLYSSLSQTLLGGISSLLMCTIIFVHGIFNKGHWPMLPCILLVIAWGGYLVLHSFFMENAEHYKLYYLLVSIILFVSLTFGLANDYISTKNIERGLLLTVVLQIICISFQLTGIIQSDNPYFIATGFSNNPNTVCILFAVMSPIIINRIRYSKYTYVWLIILFVSIIYVLCLKCRTAILGAAIIVLVHVLFNTKVQNWFKQKKSRLWFCGAISIICVIFSASALYQLKKDSANGRLLVWKISVNMIKEKPSGWGVGMFEKCYNLSQGEYFEHKHGNDTERELSDIVRMAYNDYLEQGVESGVVGMLLLISIYASLIIFSFKRENINALALVCAFAVMSTMNFIYSAILPWHVFIACSTFALYRAGHLRSPVANIAMSVLFVVICCVMMHKYASLTFAQIELKEIKNRHSVNASADISNLKRLEKHIGTSSEYYLFLADTQKRNHNYKDAIESLIKAAEYTSDSKMFFEMFSCYDNLGKPYEGIQYIRTISNILPQNMASRNILVRWYENAGMHDEALEVAQEMVNTKLKIQNPRSMQYQKGAQYYIDYYKNKLN